MAETEKPLWQGQPAHLAFIGTYLKQCGLFALAYYLILKISPEPWALLNYGWQLRQFSMAWLLNTLGILVMLAMGLQFIWTVISVSQTFYILTSERLIVRRLCMSGIRRDQLELYRVVDYILLKPLYLIPFALGNIILISGDVSYPRFKLLGINTPRDVLANIRTHVEIRREEQSVRDLNVHRNSL